MDDFPDPRDEGAVGGEDDIDYVDNEDGSGLDIQASEHQSLEEEIENVKLSQIDRFKIEDIKFLFEKYKTAKIISTKDRHIDPNDFILVDVGEGKKELRLKKFPNVSLFNKKDGMPLSINTLYQRVGMDGLRILGFEDSYRGVKPKVKLPPKQGNFEVSEEMKNYVRELKGLDKAIQTQRGELTNNLAMEVEVQHLINQLIQRTLVLLKRL